MKLIHSPLFYAAIISIYFFLKAAGTFMDDRNGGMILSVVVAGIGMFVIGGALLIDWGIRSVPVPVYWKFGTQMVLAIAGLWMLHQKIGEVIHQS